MDNLDELAAFGETLLPQANSEDEVLSFDALNYAHQQVSEGKEGNALGMVLHMGSSKRKQEMLEGLNDTTLNMKTEDYIICIQSIGFKRVLEIPFHTLHCGKERDDTFYLFWHDDGLLLRMDTFSGNRNTADIYFNYSPNDQTRLWDGIDGCSGGFSGEEGKYFFVGSIDAREALKYKLQKIRAQGKFLNPWKKCGFLWLIHYGDTNGKKYGEYDYDAINQERIVMLPKEIQAAIKGD